MPIARPLRKRNHKHLSPAAASPSDDCPLADARGYLRPKPLPKNRRPKTLAQNLRPKPSPKTFAQNLRPKPSPKTFAQNLRPKPSPQTFAPKPSPETVA